VGRGILLWLLGVPIPVIILLWLFFWPLTQGSACSRKSGPPMAGPFFAARQYCSSRKGARFFAEIRYDPEV